MIERDKGRGGEEDKLLIEAFLAGERQAFDQLVLNYQDRIYSLCYRFMGNREDADDAAQEAFMRAYRALKDFRGEAAFGTWLYRIAVNVCKNRLASLAHRVKRKLLRLGDGEGEVRDVVNGAGTPSTVMEKREQQQLLERAINALPQDQKVLVVLRDVEGLSYEQVVTATGENLGTVKSKLARARARIREEFRGKL